MTSYVEEIQTLERESNALHHALHAAYKLREQSPLRRRDWEIVAEKVRNHRSSLDPMIEICYGGAPDSITPDLRHFMLDYISVDPQFFRSGYVMERILRRVKRLALSGDEERIIRILLLRRIREKGLRNFRDICRLIPKVENAYLRAEVENLTKSPDTGVRHRATFALDYFSL